MLEGNNYDVAFDNGWFERAVPRKRCRLIKLKLKSVLKKTKPIDDIVLSDEEKSDDDDDDDDGGGDDDGEATDAGDDDGDMTDAGPHLLCALLTPRLPLLCTRCPQSHALRLLSPVAQVASRTLASDVCTLRFQRPNLLRAGDDGDMTDAGDETDAGPREGESE